jgi:hypothetical protein
VSCGCGAVANVTAEKLGGNFWRTKLFVGDCSGKMSGFVVDEKLKLFLISALPDLKIVGLG